jgi:DNA-binding CsgD family transcriptional regulator
LSRPLQLIAVSLPPGGRAAGRLLAEVDRLEASGAVRVLDLLLVSRDRDGTVAQVLFGGDEDFGALISTLFPLGGGEALGGGAPPELWAQAQSLPAGTAVGFLLVEHRWARGIFELVDEAGGVLLGAGFLTPELGLVIDAEVNAMEDAARSIVAAQDAETDAWLRAAAAQDAADAAVAASDRIRAAAAAEALRVLTAAGLVERAAAHEAAEALSAAGLVAAAAAEAAARAVEADVALVAAADDATAAVIAEDSAAVTVADAQRADAATAASVTSAEIRVLRYLPTSLTFALIADKLGISRRAAKSRAERAYKRLGVHTRADAVKRARALRIIP